MKKLAISQRVDVHAEYEERRDGLDQRWYELADQLGCAPLPLPNIDAERVGAHLDLLGPDAIILSGGNETPERDAVEAAVLKWAMRDSVPVLGVCHGMQFINSRFGGSSSKVGDHVGQRHIVTFVGDLADSGATEVNSFHNFGIDPAQLAEGLTPTAVAADGTIEAFAHVDEQVAAVMWHPERESPFSELDLFILNKYLAL